MQQIVAEGIGTEADRLLNRLRSREIESLEEAEQCTALWLAVIKRAVDDLEWLSCMEGRRSLPKHQMEELRRIRASPPAEFLQSRWFEQICQYVDLDPDLLRRNVLPGARHSRAELRLTCPPENRFSWTEEVELQPVQGAQVGSH